MLCASSFLLLCLPTGQLSPASKWLTEHKGARLRRTIVAQTNQELSRIRYLWEKIQSQRPATIFQSFAWHYLAARAFSDREIPYVIYVESDHGAALLPTAIRRDEPLLT